MGGLDFWIEVSFDTRPGLVRIHVCDDEFVEIEADVDGVYVDFCANASPLRIERLGDNIVAQIQHLEDVLVRAGWFVGCREFEDGTVRDVIHDDHSGRPNSAVWKLALGIIFSREDLKTNDLARCIRTGLRFAEMANTAENRAVQVLCAVAAVESLLSEGSKVSEKFSNRAAVLLASDPRENPGWIKLSRGVYDRRSRFVHGGELEYSDNDARHACIWMTECYQSAFDRLQMIVAAGGELPKKRKWLEELDDDFARGQSSPQEFRASPFLRKLAGVDTV